MVLYERFQLDFAIFIEKFCKFQEWTRNTSVYQILDWKKIKVRQTEQTDARNWIQKMILYRWV